MNENPRPSISPDISISLVIHHQRKGAAQPGSFMAHCSLSARMFASFPHFLCPAVQSLVPVCHLRDNTLTPLHRSVLPASCSRLLIRDAKLCPDTDRQNPLT